MGHLIIKLNDPIVNFGLIKLIQIIKYNAELRDLKFNFSD